MFALAGCDAFGGGTPTTRTVIQEAPPPVDPIVTLIATTRLHLARIDAALAAIAADAAGVAKLTPIRADRAAHLAALVTEQARTSNPDGSVSASASGAAAGPPQIEMPADATAAIAAIRVDAENAQVQFTDGVAATAKYRSAIFASISACLASHRSVLI